MWLKRPPSKIGPEIEDAQIECIAPFVNEMKLNKFNTFEENREINIYFVEVTVVVGKAM